CALSCGMGWPTPPTTSSSESAGTPGCCSGELLASIVVNPCGGGFSASRFKVEAPQQVLRDELAVGGGRAHVGDWLKVRFQCRHRLPHVLLVPLRSLQDLLGTGGAARCRGESSVGDARIEHPIAIELHAVCAANRGDVLVEALRHLVASQHGVLQGQRYEDSFQQFTGLARRLLVAEI